MNRFAWRMVVGLALVTTFANYAIAEELQHIRGEIVQLLDDNLEGSFFILVGSPDASFPFLFRLTEDSRIVGGEPALGKQAILFFRSSEIPFVEMLIVTQP
jgi:hypothetical protein